MSTETSEESVSLAGLHLPRWARGLLGAACAVGLYALVGYQLIPKLIHDQAVGYVRENYGRELSLGAVRFDPFLLSLEIDRLALPDRDGPLLSFAFLKVDFEAFGSLWRRAWVFHEITLERPELHAEVRKDGVLNLLDFASKEPAKEQPNSEPPALAIDALHLREGAVSFSDLSHSEPFAQHFAPLTFRLENFRTSKEGGQFALRARGEQDARVWWQGGFALTPVLSSRGRIAIEDVQLASLAQYAGSPVVLTQGRGNFSLSYEVGPGASATLHDALLTDLELSSRANDKVRIPELRIHEAKLDYLAKSLDIEAVRIAGLYTRAVLDAAGRLNLSRMMPASDSQAQAESPWQVKLARFDLEHATAALEDRSVGLSVLLTALDVTVKDISTDLGQPVPFVLRAALGHDGALSAQGNVTPATGDAELAVELAALRLPVFQAYARPYAALAVEDGKLSLRGKLTHVAGHDTFHGGVTLRDLRTRDIAGGRELVSLQELALDDVRYDERSLWIAKVRVQKPSARVVLSNAQTLNVSDVLHGAHGPAAKTPSAASEPMAIQVGELAIEDMRLDFSDYYIKPNFALDLRNVRGTVKGLNTDPKARAKLSLHGVLGASAPVDIEGQLLPFAYDANTDIEIRWRNVPLPVFNPYSGRFAGYNIVRGDLASTLRYQVRQGKLDAQHHVRIDQLTWGDATDTKQSATVPVRLATALLRDRDGVITLDIPVQGRLNDPQFAVWPIVKQVLLNITMKALTAPFDFLGSMFQGAEKARFVDFTPGESQLAPSQRQQLDSLAKALVERPSLTLDVPLGVDRALDTGALTEKKFQSGLVATIPKELWGAKKRAAYTTLDDDDRIDVLEALYEQLTGKKPELPDAPPAPDGTGFRDRRKLRDAFEVSTLERMTRGAIAIDPGELDALGLDRAHAIERALTEGGKIDGHRVLVSSDGSVKPEQGKVRFELALH